MSFEPDVAIVHEWLSNFAGSERCVEAMREAFPRHHVYTSVLNNEVFPGWQPDVTTSALQWFGPAKTSHIVGLPAMLPAMRVMRVDDRHDVVIRSFHTFATAPRVNSETPELVYCYTPPRFIYTSRSLANERASIRIAARAAAAFFRAGDQRRMRSVATVVAISSHIRAMIESVYRLPTEVIHPPVDVRYFRRALGTPTGDYFLFLSRLVPYKRADIAVEAFRDLPHRLLIAGEGRLRKRLERNSPDNVSFLGKVPDSEVPALMAGAQGFIFPGEEDFGIAPVEALAAGTPVIALGRGGAVDYIEHGRNGLLVQSQTPRAFAAAVRTLMANNWDRTDIAASVAGFSRERFIEQIRTQCLSLIRDVASPRWQPVCADHPHDRPRNSSHRECPGDDFE